YNPPKSHGYAGSTESLAREWHDYRPTIRSSSSVSNKGSIFSFSRTERSRVPRCSCVSRWNCHYDSEILRDPQRCRHFDLANASLRRNSVLLLQPGEAIFQRCRRFADTHVRLCPLFLLSRDVDRIGFHRVSVFAFPES